MKLLNATQIRDLDQMTIQSQNIESIELMEKAASVFFREMMKKVGGRFEHLLVLAGSGNNGGDAVAIARMAVSYFKKVDILIFNIGKYSHDLKIMMERLPQEVLIREINKGDELSMTTEDSTLLIDGIFGSGLNRPVEGYWAKVIDLINDSKGYVCSIDIPSGMFSDSFDAASKMIRADWTLSFQLPKKSFFYPEAQQYLGEWTYASIGLSKKHHIAMNSQDLYITSNYASDILRKRDVNDHKGTLGHGALITGSYGMAGASYLSAMGALRSGIGKLSCYVPEIVQEMIQTQVPEAICTGNNGYQCIESVHLAYEHDAIGIGCGLGINKVTVDWMDTFLDQNVNTPLIVDADALNIIASNQWQNRIPKGSVITPHPGEFRKLFGDFDNYDKAFEIQDAQSQELDIIIVLKIPHTRISTPDGTHYYNESGNPGMATAGSGDVLTGIITGLSAQGYQQEQAAALGVYLHGKAGDLAASEKGQYGLIARDLIEYLPYAIKSLEK
ncbi:MAG: NAD(P)H-hydrate dehydratase [Saprospiraceae bacterium]|nr:NAD(P)H-hydrate dehydratase [Saprospiraceae bacterium]